MLSRKSLAPSIGLLLVIGTLLVYARSLWAEFVNYDDTYYVMENAAVARGLCPSSVWYALTTFDSGNWIPLTWLSYEMDATLFGIHPLPFHRTNLLLHAFNVLMLFIVLFRLTGAIGRSAVVALCFGVHPLHVESVVWISERKDVLSTSCLLLSLLAYEHYAARPILTRWLLVALAMTLGLMAKSMVVTLPLLLFLVDRWPLQRIIGQGIPSKYPQQHWPMLILEKLPLFGLSLIDGIITIFAQANASAISSYASFAVRLGNAINAYAWYLWKTLIPTGLCLFYPHPLDGISWQSVSVAAVVLAFITFFVCRDVQHRPYRLFGWFWFMIALLPVIGLLQVGGQAYADRYAYIPHIGLFVLIVWEVHAWLDYCRIAPGWGIATALGIAVSWSILTIEQIGTWQNSEALWTQVFRQDPECDVAHRGMGLLRFSEHRFDEARPHLKKILDNGAFEESRVIMALATIHDEQGDWDTAAEYYRWIMRMKIRYAESDKQLAWERLKSIEREHPASVLDGAAPPRISHPAIKRGLAAARRGDMSGALRQFEEAIASDPDDADAHNNAALALMELNRGDDARTALRRAISLTPSNPNFRVNLGMLLERIGNLPEAEQQYREALRLRPQDVEVQRRLKSLEKRL